MAAIVIVPGAWHVPEHYADLLASLKSRGYDAHCPRLPTATTTLPLPSSATLADDTAVVRSQVQTLIDDGQKVILLMHSYGGIVGTGSLDALLWPQRQSKGLAGGVVGLIYMAAFVIPAGTCLNTPFGGGDNVPFLDYDTENDTISMQDARNAFYGHVESDEEAQKWLGLCTLAPAQINRDVLQWVPYEYIGKGVDATYLVCRRDLNLPTGLQEGMATLLGETSRMEYCDAGHCAMIGYAEEIVRVIEGAWEYTKGRLDEERSSK